MSLTRGNSEAPKFTAFQQHIAPLIISASGWRKIFAHSGDEEDSRETISFEDSILAGVMAFSYAHFLSAYFDRPMNHILLVLGMDSRPTGPEIANRMMGVFSALEIEVEYLGICAAPEIMAYSRTHSKADGFVYISASHNPIGHNGVKFGLSDGGVLGGELATKLIARFQELLSREETPQEVFTLLKKSNSQDLERWYAAMPQLKKASYRAYYNFATEVTGDIPAIAPKVRLRKIGIVGELNGSARTLSIDSEFLREIGVSVVTLNDLPRQIVHRIVPEGASLDPCKDALEKIHRTDPAYVLGYVPDCDGDRGNLVYFDEVTGTAQEIEAQQVFALTVFAELAWLECTGQVTYEDNRSPSPPVAVAINGPTSGRIDSIARAYGAQVHRAEVGEANVVNLARELRDRGYLVRILGEGSNGGNITYPSSVRDPLNTLVSLVKILAIPELLESYCLRTGQEAPKNPSIRTILSLLPPYTTTSAYENRAIMNVRTLDHGILKARYEELFLAQWPKKAPLLLEGLGITSWKEINYEGTLARVGTGPEFRSGKQRGGLKIVFLNSEGQEKAYIWMRGSGTEPVFRILADVAGVDPKSEKFLLDWQRSMVEQADKS